MGQNQLLKALRNKYGKLRVVKCNKCHWQRLSSKYAEENIACGLSVLHDTNRDQDWARRLKRKISLCGMERYLDL